MFTLICAKQNCLNLLLLYLVFQPTKRTTIVLKGFIAFDCFEIKVQNLLENSS